MKLAIYWARWGFWSLVDPQHLTARGNKLGIEMIYAMRVSEMAKIGDQSIGTRLPLTIRFSADRQKERTVGEGGMTNFTVSGVDILCDGQTLNGIDRSLAYLLIQFGELSGEEPVALMDGELLDAVDFNFVHQEPTDQGFEIVGSASRMFARYYAMQTIEEGKVVRTAIPLEPDLFRVLTVGDGTGHTLPLWRLILQPNPVAGNAEGVVDV